MTPAPTSPPPFDAWLDRIEERSAALRAAAALAPSGAAVPSCPGWTVPDVLAHLGGVQRFWTAAVAAGPAARPPRDAAVPPPGGGLLEWSARGTEGLLAALRAAGPDAGCWTWWAESGGGGTAGRVARHHAREAALFARDAQEAAGAPEPLPSALAVDAVDDFLQRVLGSLDGWPHAPARVAVSADEGQAWTVILDATGASAVRAAPGAGLPRADAAVAAPAGDLLLAFYRRLPWDGGALRVSGDTALIRQLTVWQPLG
jgi:uncharacterized protein (TIGR03083 family)